MKQRNAFVRFVKSSGIFFLGNVMTKLISFFLLPLYTDRIPVEDMGYYDVSSVYLNIIVSVVFIEIWSAVLRFMYDGDQIEEKYSTIKSGSFVFVCSAMVYSLAFLIFGWVTDVRYLGLIYTAGIAQAMVSFYTFAVRGLNKNIDFALSGIICVLVNALVNIVSILCFNRGFSSIYVGAIVSHIVQCIYLEARTKVLNISIRQKFHLGKAKEMFLYALPLCVNTISFWLLSGFNRIVLNLVLGNSANGLFAIGNRFGTLITMATTCFTYAWQDVSFSHASQKGEGGRFYSNACNLYSRFLLCGMLLLLPVSYFAFEIMIHENYGEAIKTIPFFLLVAVMSAISSFIGNVFYAIKETKAIFISTIVAALVNVALVYPCIRFIGINGANVSACVGFLVNIILRTRIKKKKIQLKYNWTLTISLLGYSNIAFYWFSHLNFLQSVVMFILHLIIAIVLFRAECKQGLKLINSKIKCSVIRNKRT